MRAFALAATLPIFALAIFALPVFAQDIPPIGTIGPYEAVDATPAQLVLMDRGSTDWVDGDTRIVFLILRPGGDGHLDSFLLRIRADCKTYQIAQMEQTAIDASGTTGHSDMLDNVMKPTPDGSLGRELAAATCDGAPKGPDGQTISFDSVADAFNFAGRFFAQ